MADSGRARRLAGRIRQIVASGIETQIKDPRLGMVTITEVRLTGDCHDATVFYTVLGSDFERAESAAALESARGVLRSEVGRQTGVRFTPTIRFVLDALPDNAHHIDDLLAVAARADAEVLAVRAGAVHAGDPDPYRKPRELDDDEDAEDADEDADELDEDNLVAHAADEADDGAEHG